MVESVGELALRPAKPRNDIRPAVSSVYVEANPRCANAGVNLAKEADGGTSKKRSGGGGDGEKSRENAV